MGISRGHIPSTCIDILHYIASFAYVDTTVMCVVSSCAELCRWIVSTRSILFHVQLRKNHSTVLSFIILNWSNQFEERSRACMGYNTENLRFSVVFVSVLFYHTERWLIACSRFRRNSIILFTVGAHVFSYLKHSFALIQAPCVSNIDLVDNGLSLQSLGINCRCFAFEPSRPFTLPLQCVRISVQ